MLSYGPGSGMGADFPREVAWRYPPEELVRFVARHYYGVGTGERSGFGSAAVRVRVRAGISRGRAILIPA